MKTDTKFCFVLFFVVFEKILCSESVAAEKTANFAENSRFSICLFPLCWNSVLEIVLSYAHKWVTGIFLGWAEAVL